MTLPPVDPLKIQYLVVHPEYAVTETSPFQGFGPGWRRVNWALLALAELPADVLEGQFPLDALISQRTGGARAINWLPVDIESLEKLSADTFLLFTVAFSGDEATAARVNAWRVKMKIDLLHVSSVEGGGDVEASLLEAGTVIDHCRKVFEKRSGDLDEVRRTTAGHALEGWAPRVPVPLALAMHGHNILTPNYMSLRRAGRALDEGEPFIGASAADYDEVILSSIRAVLAIRNEAGLGNAHRLFLVNPELWLIEPALYRSAYRRRGPPPAGSAAAAQAIRMIQTQVGFRSDIKPQVLSDLLTQDSARMVVQTRQEELQTFTFGVGLAAAQTTSAVMRLSPAINHTFDALDSFARSIRSGKAEHRLKQPRLFQLVQDKLTRALGTERMRFLEEEVSGPIKIVSDAPVEWLPIRGLPLMLRFQTSRLNATPGNLLMGELARTEKKTVHPDDLRKVLVISSFEPGDPIRSRLTGMLQANPDLWDGAVEVTFRQAPTVQAFIDALNAFDGAILIFDGHGALNKNGDGVGQLMIAGEPLDVWSLRGKVRAPPIVILAACDTQGLDAPSHATVGTGFLAVGSETVTATLLPVGADSAASFIGRFLYRLKAFIPVALRAGYRVLNWTEIVSGMQRMLLASEILDELIGPPAPKESVRYTLQTKVNMAINSGEEDWFETFSAEIADTLGKSPEVVNRMIANTIARSEAIRYVQLGHPENILIDDGTIFEAVAPPQAKAVQPP